MERHADVELTIRVEESEMIEHLVDSGEVHLGISALDATLKSIDAIRIYDDPIVFITPPDSFDEESGPPVDVVEALLGNYLLTHHHPVYWDRFASPFTQTCPGRAHDESDAGAYRETIHPGRVGCFLPPPLDRPARTDRRPAHATAF